MSSRLRALVAAASLVPLLAACGSAARPAAAPTATGSVDVVTGLPLASYRSDSTYPWRVNLAAHGSELLAALAKIDPAWNTPNSLARALNICQIHALAQAVPDQRRLSRAQLQVGEGLPSVAEAAAAVTVIRSMICPTANAAQ